MRTADVASTASSAPARRIAQARSLRRPLLTALHRVARPPARTPSRALLAGIGIALAACTEPVTAPPGAGAPRADAVTFWEANAAVHWNGIARQMVSDNRSPAPVAIRGYAIISVAQYNAAIAAETAEVGEDRPSVHAAIAGASVATLSYLYPTQVSALEERLDEFLDDPAWPGESGRDAEAGVAIGRAAGEQIVARARTDNFFAPGTIEVPVGPCLWFSSMPPVGALWGRAKPFLLQSSSQFRPPPPPSCGSAEFNSALAEVRQISATRTSEQEANARFWDFPVGTYTPPGYWNEQAATLALRYRRSERETAHLFALMNMVSYDAIVASHEAKFYYWLLRPTMADPAITLSIPLPNFPSYPSNHAAVSGGMARVLGHAFPAEKTRLDALADEAALSRVLAGIHYRFDGEAGLALGRDIAAWALSRDVRGHEPFILR